MFPQGSVPITSPPPMYFIEASRRLLERLARIWGRAPSVPGEALAVLESNDWARMHIIVELLASTDPAIRQWAGEAVGVIAERISPLDLVRFERRFDAFGATHHLYYWSVLTTNAICAERWPVGAWAMFSLRNSGYARQAAVEELARAGAASPPPNGAAALSGPWDTSAGVALRFLLLRLNDWVSQVREPAERGVRAMLTPAYAGEWLHVLGLLERLKDRSRADHSWLDGEVAALLLRPESRPALLSVQADGDRWTSRWILAMSAKLSALERVDFIRGALDGADPTARLWAATFVRKTPDFPQRDVLLARMARDPFMPVRRQALYGALDGTVPERRSALTLALLDRHASMRHAARVYLRDDAAAQNEAFDPRARYFSALGTPGSQPPIAGVAGLGECGQPADAALLRGFATDSRTACVAAVVRAVGVLDAPGNIDWLTGMLADRRRRVSRYASLALAGHPGLAPVDRLSTLARGAPLPHVRRSALHVLLKRQAYDAMTDAVYAACDADPAVARDGHYYIYSWDYRPIPLPPSAEQTEALLAALRANPGLAQYLARRVRTVFHLPPEAARG